MESTPTATSNVDGRVKVDVDVDGLSVEDATPRSVRDADIGVIQAERQWLRSAWLGDRDWSFLSRAPTGSGEHRSRRPFAVPSLRY